MHIFVVAIYATTKICYDVAVRTTTKAKKVILLKFSSRMTVAIHILLYLEEYEKEFLYRMLYGSQKIRNEKNSADSR